MANNRNKRVIAADEKTIWCLFSVENNYDQPDNNLVAWWSEKPSLETLFRTLGVKMESTEREQDIVSAVKVFTGESEKVGYGETSYRLEQIPEGEL